MLDDTYKYQRKELELKALLEITQAINENQSEATLVNIFKFTCLVHLDIKSLILYVLNGEVFERKISHGVKGKVPVSLDSSSIVDKKDSGQLQIQLSDEYTFDELETYLPVYHKDKLLAILFLKRKSAEMELDLDFTQASPRLHHASSGFTAASSGFTATSPGFTMLHQSSPRLH